MKYRSKNIKFFSILTFFLIFSENLSILKASDNLNKSESIHIEVKDESFTKDLETDPKLQRDFYILGPGDTVQIKFIGVDELSGSFSIMKDGNIQLPLLGTQSINGLTLEEARIKLVELYKNDLLTPQIDLSLRSARSLRVSLVGEVNRPGSYTIGGSLESQTVVDAINKAGGLTLESDITNVLLYRKMPGDEGNFKKTNLNLLNMIKTGDQSNNPILFDGDTLKISKLTDQANKIENIPNNLTPDKIRIYVIGEVSSPGMITVDSKTRISQAILIAGGPRNWRYQDKINLLRVNRNGSVDVKKISFNKEGLSKKSDSTSLRDGDIIRVKTNIFGKSTDTLKTFLPTIRDLYSLYGVYKLIED